MADHSVKQEYQNMLSSDIQNILGQTPAKLLRWSTMIFIGLTCMLVAMTYLITYSQAINGRITIGVLNPSESKNTSCYGVLIIPKNKCEKLALSQKVLINLENYPARKFGSLIGKISFISKIPDINNLYFVRINLINGLITNTGYSIQAKNGLTAKAEMIITRNLISNLFKVV